MIKGYASIKLEYKLYRILFNFKHEFLSFYSLASAIQKSAQKTSNSSANLSTQNYQVNKWMQNGGATSKNHKVINLPREPTHLMHESDASSNIHHKLYINHPP